MKECAVVLNNKVHELTQEEDNIKALEAPLAEEDHQVKGRESWLSCLNFLRRKGKICRP